MSNVLPRLSAGDLNLSNATSCMSARVSGVLSIHGAEEGRGNKGEVQ